MQRMLHISLIQVLAASVTPCMYPACSALQNKLKKTSLKHVIKGLDRLRGMQRPHLYENGGIVTARKKVNNHAQWCLYVVWQQSIPIYMFTIHHASQVLHAWC
jgi:hypothetical protein